MQVTVTKEGVVWTWEKVTRPETQKKRDQKKGRVGGGGGGGSNEANQLSLEAARQPGVGRAVKSNGKTHAFRTRDLKTGYNTPESRTDRKEKGVVAFFTEKERRKNAEQNPANQKPCGRGQKQESCKRIPTLRLSKSSQEKQTHHRQPWLDRKSRRMGKRGPCEPTP